MVARIIMCHCIGDKSAELAHMKRLIRDFDGWRRRHTRRTTNGIAAYFSRDNSSPVAAGAGSIGGQRPAANNREPADRERDGRLRQGCTHAVGADPDERDVGDRADDRCRDVDLAAQDDRGLLAEDVADDAAGSRRQNAHDDGDHRAGAGIEALGGSCNRDEGEAHGIEPKQRAGSGNRAGVR